ncbi:transcription-repair coupling factor [Serpentinicella sp. ANB-PHB4]|uniref:transcription-repair coupling factor n=1 Tax=Serpentinicella sp. ANB-PHB4 TaxID=3074076 RepID=UPI002862B0DA|nr:transcription-repair coupling factor [Serpentinicella sp. ANB-PHB4]MDR5659186.1 transcription-repair coupling factor [Serpentinicella sp. ANB-PHB4]
MLYQALLNPIKQSIAYQQLMDNIQSNKLPTILQGLIEVQKGHFISCLFEDIQQQVCIVTHTELEARQIYEDLSIYLDDKAVFFPKKDILYHRMEAMTDEGQETRVNVLKKLLAKEPCIIITTIEALLFKLPNPDVYKNFQLKFCVGETIELENILETLTVQGYESVEMVEAKGEYSLRGGILDVYPMTEKEPIRIELFDDEIDSIRGFEVDTQKSVSRRESVDIYPAAQTVIEKEDRILMIQGIRKELEKRLKTIEEEKGQVLEKKINSYIEKLENTSNFNGIETFYPYVQKQDISLLDYIDREAILFIDEPNRIKSMGQEAIENFRSYFNNLLETGEVLPTQGNMMVNLNELLMEIQKRRLILLSLLPQNPVFEYKEIQQVLTRPVQMFHGKIDILKEQLNLYLQNKYKVVLLLSTKDKALNLLEELKNNNISVQFLTKDNQVIQEQQVNILVGHVQKGFEYVQEKFIVITDYEIFGVQKKKKHAKKMKNAAPIKSFIDLKVGDLVVHEGHGIGKYEGIEQLRVEGVKKDYLKISYFGQDSLYVPTDQMDLIQKYIGGDDRKPKLNKLGGTEWAKTKHKVKKAIEDMAEDLLKLYAQRQEQKGYAFSEDTEWQKEFEYMFPYEETPDQLKSIAEVKKDMESEKPMDRLLCGDVGYGKTEVAIRAAFKSVMDGRQVAFLVPTTILAQQHYNNFKQRFSKFPVKVEMLSRFKTPIQQKKILKEAEENKVDVIIGTHRILSKDLKFKNLGLLIIDEEQRFGVKHKEVLKQLKQSIDVLTLTATPIPRTLHMSLIGIRDMSVIEDPPEERYPVQTYVSPFNEALIIDAITREVNRGGQVFYVYNRVQGIHAIANRITNLMPQMRVAVAHGQMGERQLEKLMLDFYYREYDILVCTTIIETGLDIQNVNTILIHDADKLGLSQLYQLRGRVGRSNRQSYAYLMFERDKMLSEASEKRLKAIKEFTEFGSGFKIAMRDLEIRGSGNLLGAQQHGHMSAIGYDLYVKLLEETMAELKGEKVEKYEDTLIEVNIDAFISERFIKNHSQKIEVYKKIALIRELQDMYDIEEEIEDRYGDIPTSVRNLLQISYIKALAQKMGVQSIQQKDNDITIQFKDLNRVSLEEISNVLNKFKFKLTFHAQEQPYFIYKIKKGIDQEDILKDLRKIIEGVLS